MNYPTMNYCIAYKKQLCIMKMDILKYVTNQLFIDFFSYNSYEKKKVIFSSFNRFSILFISCHIRNIV